MLWEEYSIMNDYEARKIEYLKMVQEPINRMSTKSSIIKGFTVTVLVGLFSLLGNDVNNAQIIFVMVLVVMCACLNIYYLKLERKFRFLYELIRVGNKEMDFSMSVKNLSKKEQKDARATLCKCIFSTSILVFYLPVILLAILTIILYETKCFKLSEKWFLRAKPFFFKFK
jgi:hypothetical protein